MGKREQKVASLLSGFFGSNKSKEATVSEVEVPREEEEQQHEHSTGETHLPKPKKQKAGKMALRQIKPMTFTQEDVFKSFMSGNNLMLHGLAGTGKSFVGLYLALKECERYQQVYDKVVIIRSGVPSRDLGYLPGSVDEKAAVYEAPYEQIVNKLYDRGDAYSICKSYGKIEFMTTSFLRGVTFERCIVLVDEIQNMTYGELSTIITRVGDNCRLIFSGDYRQTDLFRSKEREGLFDFLNIIKRMDEFSFHEFTIPDIVRGKLVKSFIVEEADYRDANPSFQF